MTGFHFRAFFSTCTRRIGGGQQYYHRKSNLNFNFTFFLNLFERSDASLFWASQRRSDCSKATMLFQIQKAPAHQSTLQGQNKKCSKVRHWDKTNILFQNQHLLPQLDVVGLIDEVCWVAQIDQSTCQPLNAKQCGQFYKGLTEP